MIWLLQNIYNIYILIIIALRIANQKKYMIVSTQFLIFTIFSASRSFIARIVRALMR